MAPETFRVALLALVVVTAGCLGGAVPGTDASTDSDDTAASTIAVSATGTTEVAPDEAVARVAVVATGEDPATVRDALATGADDLRSALADAGIDDVTSAGYSLRPDYRDRDRDGEPARYRGVHVYTVTVAPTEVGAAVDAAADAGAVVQGVRFTLSESARRDARAAALAEAMGDARAQADVVAGEADLTVEGVNSASTSDVRFRRYEMRGDTAAGASAPRTTVEPGPVTVTATVQVTYDAT